MSSCFAATSSLEASLFMFRRTKLKLPQMESLVSRKDAEFINYFACLRQCNVLEVADADWLCFWLLMENFTPGGHLKQVISKQASILELPHGNVGMLTSTKFLKSIKKQMSYNHRFMTTEITGVQALTLAVRVEVEQGFPKPYKQSHLRRELLTLRLPPQEDGTLGETFIDGAHEILTSPGRGNVQILFQNRDATELFLNWISGGFGAHLYWYLCREKGYTQRCCWKMPSSWFAVQDALQAPDAKRDPATYTVTTLKSITNLSFDADMASLGIGDIAPELL